MAFRPTLSALRVRLDAADDCRRDGDHATAGLHDRAALKLVLEITANLPIKILEELRASCPAAARELNTRLAEALRRRANWDLKFKPIPTSQALTVKVNHNV